MQRAQRTFGRFLKRTPNEADVEAMLSDFNDSEQMLEKVRFVVPTRRGKNRKAGGGKLPVHEQAEWPVGDSSHFAYTSNADTA
jgi:hypothetical protein